MRYNITTDKLEEDHNIEAFLQGVLQLCRKHNLGLIHQNTCGDFVVARGLLPEHERWLNDAIIGGLR
jgi:hypothetical protein